MFSVWMYAMSLNVCYHLETGMKAKKTQTALLKTPARAFQITSRLTDLLNTQLLNTVKHMEPEEWWTLEEILKVLQGYWNESASLPCSANCVHWVQTSITDCVWPLKITGCTWDVLSHFQKPLWALFLFNKPSHSTFQQKLTGNPRVIYVYVKKQIFLFSHSENTIIRIYDVS